MKKLITIGLILFFALQGFAQTQRAFIQAAEEAFGEENYYAALDYYLNATEFDSTNIDLFYKAAESARNFQSYHKAEELYTYVMSADSDARYPYVAYHLGHMQQMQGKYDLAKRNYELYLSQYEGDNPRYTDKARKEIASIEWAQGKVNHPDPSVSIRNLGEEINTPQSEFAAIIDGDELTYTSVNYYPRDRKKYSNKYIGKVLSASQDTSVRVWEDFNRPNLHTGNVIYNMNKSKMFYTLCEYINDSDIRCDIYCRPILGDGTYGPEMKLPDHINQDSSTTTQPNIGFDKSTGQEILYFVSDRQGGKGRLDIWASQMTGVDSFAEPINVSEVNTSGDDVSPFYHNTYQVLFFSSNGELGLGGYDIYRSIKDENGYHKGVNVGAPTNSSYNEVFYTLSEDGKRALFSSNRPGSQYIDEYNQSCCYDIYEAEIDDIIINLNALTFDAKSLDSLEGVTVQLVDAETGDVINTITNDIANDHIFQLERGKEYLLISSKPGYHPDTLPINTKTIFSPEDISRKIYLERSTLDLEVFTFDEISREALPGTTVILENLTDGTVQQVTLTNETSNDFLFEVIPGHSYRLTTERDRYYPKSIEFVANDNEGTGRIRKDVYLARRNLNIYLPLALYFENDIPDKRNRSLTTDRRYAETFDEYVILKNEYQKRYASGLRGEEKALAEQRVSDFFEQDVKGGYDRFMRFLDYLYGKLQDGESFDISIRGFASPRADTKYNLALSQRRVVSVQNELRAYRDGVLSPYIDNGQLKITELSYGESLAPDNVSDVLYNRAASIYSPEASRERRAEIVEIKQGE